MHSSSWLRCRKKFERLITLITHFTVLRISVKSLITKPRKEKLVGIESTLAWGRYKAFYSHIFNTRNPDDPPIFIKFAGFSVVELVITFQQCIADFLCLCSFIFSIKTPLPNSLHNFNKSSYNLWKDALIILIPKTADWIFAKNRGSFLKSLRDMSTTGFGANYPAPRTPLASLYSSLHPSLL